MPPSRPHLFLLAALLILPGIACTSPRAAESRTDNSILAVIRQYGQGAHVSEVAAPANELTRASNVIAAPGGDEKSYIHCITMLLYSRNYDELEREALAARAGKIRFVGGVWKLNDFYAAVSGSSQVSGYQENDFITLHLLLSGWESAKPRSATAKIALAEMYLNWGYYARGTGFADTVTDNGWKLFKARAEIAKGILVQAAQFDEKCPYWYEAMQHVALDQGWDKSQARYLLDQAVQYEPGYYHFYREYALFLEPRWYGEQGEAENVAEEISNRVGGEEGAHIYFEIASLLTCQCSPDPYDIQNLSWPKIKEGFAALNHLYGVSNLKQNRFAYMAYIAGDQEAARAAFAEIGESWSAEPWGTKENFENAKAWATRRPEKPQPTIVGSPKPPIKITS